MSSYPVPQYRRGGQGNRQAFQPRRPLPVRPPVQRPRVPNPLPRPPSLPVPRVNANLPKWAAAGRMAKVFGRAGLRGVPYLGAALLAWDIYDLFMTAPAGVDGYVRTRTCQSKSGTFQDFSTPNCGTQIQAVPSPVTGRPSHLYEYEDVGPGVFPGRRRFNPIERWEIVNPVGAPAESPSVRTPPRYSPIPRRPPRPRPRPRARPRPRPRPRVPVFPGLPFQPVAEPNGTPLAKPPTSHETVVSKGRVTTRTRRVARRPPGPGVKERKSRAMPNSLVTIQRIVHAVSEANDFLDAAHKALPKKYQVSDKAPPQAKAEAVYRHADEIDINEFLANLRYNEVEDFVLGSANANVDKWARDNGIILGPFGLG